MMMTLEKFYRALNAKNQSVESLQRILRQAHWFGSICEFDPRTGEALPQTLSSFLAKASQDHSTGVIRDRLWRITEHARPAILRLFRELKESPRREHALMPVYKVRELDANSLIKLSMRPGRTIKEKLGGKPHLQAVRRFQSVNLPENRLLKAFVVRMEELLELRSRYLDENEDDLLIEIRSWLHSDEAKTIGRWENLPPNNTLLSHRDYRRIWDAWRWLQTIDEDISRDIDQIDDRDETMRKWNKYGQMYSSGMHIFAELPIFFDYDVFEVQPWVTQLLERKSSSQISRLGEAGKIDGSICIDLTTVRPRYATTLLKTCSLTNSYLWQQWQNNEKSIDITLFYSDAVCSYSEVTTISLSDLFFPREKLPVQMPERAARAFVDQLRITFSSEYITWLVPDFQNEFELAILRRNLNAKFACAEPLPRSVAAVFEQVDYSKITHEGYSVVVVDRIGGRICVIKLIAKQDPKLKKKLPQTRGFYWERCPPILLPQDSVKKNESFSWDHEILTVDDKGEWYETETKQHNIPFDREALKRDIRIGNFEEYIYIDDSPVRGGRYLQSLQQESEGIPLWCDQIPELSVKVIVGGDYQRFYLVKRGQTVNPIRGRAVPIAVSENFTLPAGRSCYPLPLFQGEKDDELGYSARLDSPSFPLKKNVECKLSLTFTYGADEPYELVFHPIDKSFPPVRAKWCLTEETIVTDAVAPDWPAELSWNDLRLMPKPGSEESRDMLEWFLAGVDRFIRSLFIDSSKRVKGKLTTDWKIDKNGKLFSIARNLDDSRDIFLHENNFLSDFSHSPIKNGDILSFELAEFGGKLEGRNITDSEYKQGSGLKYFDKKFTRDTEALIRKSLFVPFIQIWSQGRSISDVKCPIDFSNKAQEYIGHLDRLHTSSKIPRRIVKALLFLLACLHKDTVESCVNWLTKKVKSNRAAHAQEIGFSLGDVSENWQLCILELLTENLNESSNRVFAYAIWREKHFIEKFSIKELNLILDTLLNTLCNIGLVELDGGEKKDNWNRRNWGRQTAEPLELLLGLLRTRESSNEEIKMLLQPHQKITKKLAEQLDRVAEIVTQSNVHLFSRIQIDVKKPEGVRTPDLIYALRLYLTGDDGANAIHITGISESDE